MQRNRKVRHGAVSAVAAAVQRLYDKSAPLLVCEGVLFAVIAVFMLFQPIAFLSLLTVVIGISLLLFGLYRTIAGFVISQDIGGGWVDVMFGLINIVLGVLFCLFPAGAGLSVVYIFIILFFFKALRALVFAINMVRARFGHYIFDLIMALVLVGLALLFMLWPTVGQVAVIYYMAIGLFIYAVSDFYMFIELFRLKKHVMD